MKALSLARAFGAAFALVMVGFLAAHANIASHWNSGYPSTFGPWLGDSNVNVGTLYGAVTNDSGRNFWPALSVDQTSGQSNCTQLNTGFSEVKTSASTGYVCLPTAFAGREVVIGNASGQTIDIYSSAVSFTAGTADTINGTAGSTAYTGLTSGKTAICAAAANGAWYCGSIS